jgi:glycerol-3-phosphate dehydrogenase
MFTSVVLTVMIKDYLCVVYIPVISLFRGSAIAKIVGVNCKRLPNFEDRVTMYVFEEMIDGKKLTEIINTTHENVKYLPGHKLPENVVSKL